MSTGALLDAATDADGRGVTPEGRVPSSRQWTAVPVADLAVAGILGLVLVWRWTLVTSFPGPIGVDSGNWLRLANAMMGRVDIQDVIVPPLVPLIAVLTDALVGPLTTARLLPTLASIAPALGLWAVVRMTRRDTAGVAMVAALAVAPPTAAAFAWGGVPQLVGLGLLPIALLGIARATVRPGGRAWLRAGALAALVGLTSTLASALLAAGGIAIVLVAVMRLGRAPLAGIGAAAPPLVPVAGLYAVILARMSLPEGRATGATGLHALSHGLGEPTALWLALVTLLSLVVLLSLAGRSTTPTTLLLVGLAAVTVAGVMLGDVRFVAGVPTAVAAGAVLLRGPRLLAAPVRAVAVAGLLVIATVGVGTQTTQLGFYAQFAPERILEDVARIAAIVPAGATVAVPPVAGAPVGWWLEARGVDAAVASRSDWLSFPGERAAAADVLAVFSAPAWPDGTTDARACAIGAPWLYVPTEWGGMDDRALERELAAGRLSLVERLPGGLLLRSGSC
jgi:hypothetical protein